MADATPSLDYEEQLGRIALAREEAQKFAAEQHKLAAEASKFDVERVLYPVALAIGVMGAVVGSAATTTLLAHWLR